jgi:GTP pyrophosphokinase
MITAKGLVKKIKEYHKSFDEDLVIKAYQLSKKAHSKQFRSSGEPYFSHPLEVAQILIEFRLDASSIITAILHDTVEDTDVTLGDIEKEFGSEIASLVDGVTKLTKIESLPSTSRAAENFRKLVMAMSQDIRVLLVKLADRLHNMRTIHYISSKEKRIRISNESLIIYAPLAARIGMYHVRDELQELSFEQIHKSERKYIVERLKELKKKRKTSINKIIDGLKSKISQNVKNCEIHGREKTPYSIWNKMRQKNVSFYHLYDIMAFRIVVDDLLSCYSVLGIINSNYSMIPGSFKDYISTPKENNYRSLHLVVLGPDNKKIEIQIRSRDMHDIAEYGVAAHWSYKQKEKLNSESNQYKWIRDLIGLFEHAADASEVLQNHKIQMHKDQVFCFTPSGDVFNLPNGATIVDFAYAIHSEVGDSCASAKVNGESSPLRQKLENGDQIEIITSKKSKPSLNWLQFITTSKARAAIKHFMREAQHNEYTKLGKAIIAKYFNEKNLEINDKLMEKSLILFNKKTLDELYIFIAEGLISRRQILDAIYPNFKESKKGKLESNNANALPIEGLISGMAMNFATCCSPIPGDEITGIINTGTGIMIHNKNCSQLKNIVTNQQMLIDVCWKNRIEEKEDLYQSRLKVLMKNQSGTLADVSSAMAKRKINITNIDILNRAKEYFELIIDIEVKSAKHLESVILSLRILDKILEVDRYDG